jgi:hypothetical protein
LGIDLPQDDPPLRKIDSGGRAGEKNSSTMATGSATAPEIANRPLATGSF